MANITSCDDVLQQIQPTRVTSDLINIILPNICGIINTINTTAQSTDEKVFYHYCCDPIPHTLNITSNYFGSNISTIDWKSFTVGSIGTGSHCAGNQKHICELWDLLTIIILSVLTPIGLVTNTLILSLIGKIKDFQKTTTGYIRCMVVLNLLAILQTILMTILYESDTMYKASFEVQLFLFPTLEMVLGSASMLFVAALAIGPCMAVCKPELPDTQKNISFFCRVFILIYCFVLLTLGLIRIKHSFGAYDRVFFYVTTALGFALPLLVVITAYSVIVFSAFQYRKIENKANLDESQLLTNQERLGCPGKPMVHSDDIIAGNVAFVENVSKKIQPNLDDSVKSLVHDGNPSDADEKVLVNQEENQECELFQLTRPQEIKISSQIGAMVLRLICGWIYYISSIAYERISGRYIFGLQSWSVLFAPFIVSCLSPLVFTMFTWPMWKCVLSKWCNKFLHTCLERKHTIARI